MKVPESISSKWKSLWTVGFQALAISHSPIPRASLHVNITLPLHIHCVLGMALVPWPVGQGFVAQGCLRRVGREHAVRTRVWRGGRVGLVVLHGCGYCVRSRHGCLRSVEVGFFLKLADILLVPDSFVAKPVGYLQITGTWVKGKTGRKEKSQTSNNNCWTLRGSLGAVISCGWHGFWS